MNRCRNRRYFLRKYHQDAKLAYPYAAEYHGNLHVMYSAGRRPGNENDAELAVIPVRELS